MAEDTRLEDWALLAQFSQVYRTLSDALMEEIDMHRAQAALLCRLFEKDGITQSEIAEQLSVQGATVTSMLQRIEESGFVVRQRDPEDNRLVRVYLTDKGREKERSINEQFATLERAIFEGISEKDREHLRRILRQMLQNVSTRV